MGKPAKKVRKLDDDEVSEGEWSDEDEDDKDKKKKKDKKGKKELLGKRNKREAEQDQTLFEKTEIEVVPQEKFDEGYSSMDSDDIAETRALAKLMLRKKARNEILEGTYNRFANHDDVEALPEWFVEDERKTTSQPSQ